MNLNKRLLRDLKQNFPRWFALMLLIVISMYVVVSMVASADTVTTGVKNYDKESNAEDGEFSVFVPLSQSDLQYYEDNNIHIVENFYMDFILSDNSTLRVFKLRDDINIQKAVNGTLPEKANEMMLEKHYAGYHEIKTGDTLNVGDIDFSITGIGVSPDYDNVTNNLTDIAADPKNFGVCFVTPESYDKLKASGKLSQSETYLYSYEKKDECTMTDDDFKDSLKELDFNTDLIEDDYIRHELDKVEKKKKDLKNDISDLKSGSEDFKDALQEYKDSTVILDDGVGELLDGSGKLTDGIKNLYDGAKELSENSSAINSGAETVFQALLSTVQSQLSGLGMDSDLTIDNYQYVLSAVSESVDYAVGQKISELKNSLDSYDRFYNGLLEYTGGVNSLAEGASQLSNTPVAEYTGSLSNGLAQLNSNSETLNSGAGQIFDSLLALSESQLAQNGVNVSLSRDNYSDVLSNVSAGESISRQISDIQSQLKDVETFYQGVLSYTDGVDSLFEGIETLQNSTGDLTKGIRDLKDGTEKLSSGTNELYDGFVELNDGVNKLSDSATEMIDKIFDENIQIDNLFMFLTADESPRIAASVDNVNINKSGGIIGGIILMVLISYVISVFVVHNINEDSVSIGTLYSMGVSRATLTMHYILLPMIVTFIGGVIGTIIGFSPFGVSTMMKDHEYVYSFPDLDIVYPLYLIIYGVVVPPVVTLIVVYLVIRKKLNMTPLSLLRKTAKAEKVIKVKLNSNLGFINEFRIRQILREVRTSVAMFFGMFVSMLILILGVICLVCTSNLKKENENDIKYEYMYSLKYELDKVPEGAEICYAEGLKKEELGYSLDVTLLGLEDNSSYFDFELPKEKNTIVVGNATAIKYHINKGDMVYFTDESNNRVYTFKVADIVQYSLGLHIFMNIDNMRELYGKDDSYYNTLLSGDSLDVDSSRVYNIITKQNLIRFAKIFEDSMSSMVNLLIVSSIIVFVVVMYLMIKVMIDKSSFHISLIKTFGYTDREVRKMYLDGNLLTIIISGLISVPLSRLIMQPCWLFLCSNIAGGFNIHIPWYLYAGIYGLILGCYFIINGFLMIKLKKISPADILKNRE